MVSMKVNKVECLEALLKANENAEAFNLIESLINDHFAMIEHMKETSLYDVYMYEERFAKNSIEPIRILAYDNERLKKEINKLRRQIGLSQKYKEVN